MELCWKYRKNDHGARLSQSSRRRRNGAQGAWTKWTTTDRKLTWAFASLLRSFYDLLPSPSNLHRWGLHDHPKCQWCDKTGSMEHIMSSCTTSLTQGRYRLRHDSVLQELADKLERERTKTCLHLKMEFCSCARGRQWCGIIHYH